MVHQCAELMRSVDPDIKLLAAATRKRDWSLPLLKAAGKDLDYVAVHQYWFGFQRKNLMPDYKACIKPSEGPEQTIREVIEIIEEAAEFVAKREINAIAKQYTMADALFSASFLNACLRHCEDVGMANIAPIVNTRGPLYVYPKGIVKRTTFHVLSMYANLLESRVAKFDLQSGPLFKDKQPIAAVDAVVTTDESGKRWSIALINRHPDQTAACTIKMGDRLLDGEFEATVLAGDSPEAFNDVEHPERVVPEKQKVQFSKGAINLPPHSLTVVRNSAQQSGISRPMSR
jgi:alpha-N-arabinofuranosidase